MFVMKLEQSRVDEPVPSATEINTQVVPPVQHQEIAEEPIQEDTQSLRCSSSTHITLVPGAIRGSAPNIIGNVNATESTKLTTLQIISEDGPNLTQELQNGVIEDCGFNPSRMNSTNLINWSIAELVPHPILCYGFNRSQVGSIKVSWDTEFMVMTEKQASVSCNMGFVWGSYMTVINANVLSNFVSLQCLSSLLNALLQNTMAEQNVPAQPPTRTDEQIVPRSQWLTIGKSNLLFNAQKIQKNPIFQISVDILRNTNFFQALLLSICSGYLLQRSGKRCIYTKKTRVFSCQVVKMLRYEFCDFNLGGAILSCSTHCLTERSSGLCIQTQTTQFCKLLWGNHHYKTTVDHAELIWEEFTQGNCKGQTATQRVTPKKSLCKPPHPVKLKTKPDSSSTKKTFQAYVLQKIRKDNPTFLSLTKKMKLDKSMACHDLDWQEGVFGISSRKGVEKKGMMLDSLDELSSLSLDPRSAFKVRAPVGGVYDQGSSCQKRTTSKCMK
ncbi:hypothetical protein Tco_0031397 [Tanacetum coccineum]